MKNFIIKPIKYYFYFVFILSAIVLINGMMLIDKPMYMVIKGDNIRTGPSSKNEIIRKYQTWHIRLINIESNNKGWHKLKTDFLGLNFIEDMYIWIDNKSTKENILTLENNDLKSYFPFYIKSYEYFFSIINLQFDLDGFIDNNKNYNRDIIGNTMTIVFLTSILSLIITPILFLNSIFKRDKKLKDSVLIDNSVSKNDIKSKNSITSHKKSNKELVLEKKDKESLPNYFEQNFTKFKESEIPKIKKTLGIDLNYTIEDAVKDNNYEVFNTLVKMELIKQGEIK